MISLETVFWLMICFMGLIGALRGWTKEVIAASGLILSLFALDQAGIYLINFVNGANTAPDDAASPARTQFYILVVTHVIIAFFSYQGPVLAGRRLGEKLRVRDNLQDKILGALVGGLNGYLLVGSLWSFLEFQLIARSEWQRLDPGIAYAFDPTILTRPAMDSDVYAMLGRMPIPFLEPALPILIVFVFLFVIIVII